jgi:glutaredoxin 3
MQNVPVQLQNYVKKGTVFVFSKTVCPFCDKAKQLLKLLNVKFLSVEVDKDKTLKNDHEFIKILQEHSKINTYPKIYIGVNCIGGFTDLRDRFQNGELYKILKEEEINFTPKL